MTKKYNSFIMKASRKILFIVIITTLFVSNTFGQHKEWSAWLGNKGYLSFFSDTPKFVPAAFNFSGGLPYCDSTSGEINFVDVGNAVYNNSSDLIDEGMMQCGGGYYAVPFPSGENKFYLFHTFIVDLNIPSLAGLQTRCGVAGYYYNISSNRLYYSILDMDANGGLGTITSANNYWDYSYNGSLKLVRHANGKDVWLLNGGATNYTSAYLISSSGIGKGVVSNVGVSSFGDVSPLGNRIVGSTQNNNQFALLDFNNSTGILGNQRIITTPGYCGNQCFSPDGTKLYVSISESTNCTYKQYISQMDLSNPNLPLYKISSINGAMKRALNGKIYVSRGSVTDALGNNKYQFDAILYPNQPNTACCYHQAELMLDQYIYLPDQINDIIVQKTETPIINFNFPQTNYVCFGSFTLTATSGYDRYYWNTGDSSNAITVTKPGNYSVLAYKNGVSKPVAYGFTELKSNNLPLNLGGVKSACTSNKIILTIPQGFKNILWNDNDTSTTKVISYPTRMYNYVVTATDKNGCSASDSACVSFNSPPMVALGDDTTLCNGKSLTLYASYMEKQFPSGQYNYQWSTGSTGSAINITQPGNYWCIGKTSAGCAATDTINVNYFNPKDIFLGRDTALCFGDSLLLTANAVNVKYKWNTGDSTNTIKVKNNGN